MPARQPDQQALQPSAEHSALATPSSIQNRIIGDAISFQESTVLRKAAPALLGSHSQNPLPRAMLFRPKEHDRLDPRPCMLLIDKPPARHCDFAHTEYKPLHLSIERPSTKTLERSRNRARRTPAALTMLIRDSSLRLDAMTAHETTTSEYSGASTHAPYAGNDTTTRA